MANRGLERFQELVAEGHFGLDGTSMLPLAERDPPGSAAGSATEGKDWILVAMAELVRLQVIEVTGDFQHEVTMALGRVLEKNRQAREGFDAHRLGAQDQWSVESRLKILGTVAFETHLLLHPTTAAENGNATTDVLPDGMLEVATPYINAICGQETDYVDVRAPRRGVTRDFRGILFPDHLRMKLDHLKVLQVVEHIAIHHPPGASVSDLREAMEKLITKLAPPEGGELHVAADRARMAFTSRPQQPTDLSSNLQSGSEGEALEPSNHVGNGSSASVENGAVVRSDGLEALAGTSGAGSLVDGISSPAEPQSLMAALMAALEALDGPSPLTGTQREQWTQEAADGILPPLDCEQEAELSQSASR